MARGMAEFPNCCQKPGKLIGIDPGVRDGGKELIVENCAPQIDVVNRLEPGLYKCYVLHASYDSTGR
jgi:hypothetical protein